MNIIDRLISHRFRGFSDQENTIAGLNATLTFGVQNLEFDIRVAKCGTPMIYHDEYALDDKGVKRTLSNVMASDFKTTGGAFAHMPRADALFKAIAEHPNSTAKLLVDIKDAGFEHEIHALICLYKLQSRIIYVSWLPEVLFAMHEISPQTPLCLSHWCASPDLATRAVHTVHRAIAGHIPKPKSYHYIQGHRSGWYVKDPLCGALRNILIQTKGWVCVPQDMISRDLVRNYQDDGIRVSAFSYTKWSHIMSHEKDMKLDGYFIDNKSVFDTLDTRN